MEDRSPGRKGATPIGGSTQQGIGADSLGKKTGTVQTPPIGTREPPVARGPFWIRVRGFFSRRWWGGIRGGGPAGSDLFELQRNFAFQSGSRKSKSWLVIIVQAVGEVRHFQLERRTRVIFSLGAIVFAASLAYFGYGYFTLFYERQDLMNQLARWQERASWLDQKLQRVSVEKLPGFRPVNIDDFKVIRITKRGGVSIRFRILNTHPLDQPFLGTLVMVAKNESLNPPLYLAKPEMEVKNGSPAHPEKGTRIEVKNQNFVEALFEGAEGRTFKAVTIYLYSIQRKLILQKTLEVSEK